MKTIALTEDEFLTKVANFENNREWKYLGDRPCIIDFYANWCGPCKTIAPILEELAGDFTDQIYIYKVDVDHEESLAAAFGVQSIPTLFFCSMHGSPQVIRGAMSKVELKRNIEHILLKKE